MNHKATYRSIWEEGTVETNCEITPKGEIINIECADPQFEADALISEEVSLCTADVTLEVVSNDDGEQSVKDFHPLLRYLVLNINNIPFSNNGTFDGFAIYDALMDAWVADPNTPSEPYVCDGVREGQQHIMSVDLNEWHRLHDAVGVSRSQGQSTRIELPVFGISIEISSDGCGGIISSNLKEADTGSDAAMDAIESMILAHAIAGIDISSPAYIEGIEIAVQSCANIIGNDKADENPSDEMSQWYASHLGTRCPVCKKDTLDAGGSIEVDGGTATQEIGCRTCGSYWDDQYRLFGFSSLNVGNDDK